MIDRRGEKMQFQYVLFDLDGTLTDPKMGITQGVQYALSRFDIVEEDLDSLEPFIGPSLSHSTLRNGHFFSTNLW
jgi:phosphoglycolate phosphatase